MPAMAVICPMILNQAVNQPQPLPPRRHDQWYIAPEVGSAVASSAMLQTTASVKSVTRGQPKAISAGPPIFSPCPYSVTAPVRIEMIENEMAKLEKPPIVRKSSCAYPSLLNSCSSTRASGCD